MRQLSAGRQSGGITLCEGDCGIVSSARTLVIAPPQAIYGSPRPPSPLFWPDAEPDDFLDYSADITAWLTDVDDILNSASVSIAPSGCGDMVCSRVVAAGGLITAWLGGGIAGRDYTVKLLIRTLCGRYSEWPIGLTVLRPLITQPLPDYPLCEDFGVPVIWYAATPLMINLARPLSSSMAAAIF